LVVLVAATVLVLVATAALVLAAAAVWTFGVTGRTAAVLAVPDRQNAVTTPAAATPAAAVGTTTDRRRLERTVDGCWLAKGFLPGQDALTWKVRLVKERPEGPSERLTRRSLHALKRQMLLIGIIHSKAVFGC